MASSRHLRGSVLSRVRDLLKSGVMKEVQKPVWFDVVATFPPLTKVDLTSEAERGRLQKIVYPEDAIRRKFYSKYEVEAISLNEPSSIQTTCDRFVEKCLQLVDNGSTESEAFDKTVTLFKNELEDIKKTVTASKRRSHSMKEPSHTLYDLSDVKPEDEY